LKETQKGFKIFFFLGQVFFVRSHWIPLSSFGTSKLGDAFTHSMGKKDLLIKQLSAIMENLLVFMMTRLSDFGGVDRIKGSTEPLYMTVIRRMRILYIIIKFDLI